MDTVTRVALIVGAVVAVGGIALTVVVVEQPPPAPYVRPLEPAATVEAPPPSAPVPTPMVAPRQGPNCETLVLHRDDLSAAEITVIEQNAHRLGMSPDELLYWQTQARAKGMDPYAWDTIKLASKMTPRQIAGDRITIPTCVPH
jgi:hypothetical protein